MHRFRCLSQSNTHHVQGASLELASALQRDGALGGIPYAEGVCPKRDNVRRNWETAGILERLHSIGPR